jgi:hypothetical protein
MSNDILLKISKYLQNKTEESFEEPFNSIFKDTLIGVDYINQIFIYDLEGCAEVLSKKLLKLEKYINEESVFTSEDLHNALDCWSKNGKYKRALLVWTSMEDNTPGDMLSKAFAEAFADKFEVEEIDEDDDQIVF